ncbi:hypothetical protein H9P43_000887 [Blastocladiella emersonii ATCC 22665]|nr:hypothetical protein H9P43_000887 [Blastocladiella emersonii ATCC 22665]
MTTTTYSSIVVLLALVALANGHMMMSDPAPWASKFSPGPKGQIDYSYTSPLGKFPCKGYAPQASVKTVKAGSSLPVTIIGGATHDGGHCQFALSYDNQKTWVVLDTIIRDCLRPGTGPFTYNIPIPASAPGGDASIAWAWINAVGNREYYMSCSTITIDGPKDGSITGPELLVANLPGFPLRFPEFGGKGDDKRELFDQRKIITVRGNGSVAPGPGPAPRPTSTATTGPRPTSTSAAPKPTRTVNPPKPTSTSVAPRPTRTVNPPPYTRSTSSAAPKPTTNPGKGQVDDGKACTEGQMRCTTDGKKIGMCNRGKWIDMDVPAGAACKTGGDGQAFIGFA